MPELPDVYAGAAAVEAGVEAEAQRDARRWARLPAAIGIYDVRADEVRKGVYGAIKAVHLMQTDNNVQPLMGRVHMVRVPGKAPDKHFMRDVLGDANEGQRVLKQRGRRGPFRDQSGRSTVMDRSRHVSYRKRSGVFEVTVRRGAINAELQQLLSKLSLHRASVHGSYVVIVKGRKKYRLGRLDQLDLRKLLSMIQDCLHEYGVCGVQITEHTAGAGALYKSRAHSAKFKNEIRLKRGVFAQ